jgi:hypothetical protein
MKQIWFVVAILLILVGCGQQQEATPTVTPEPLPTETIAPTPTVIPAGLYVDATDKLGAISPLVYGTNYGPWAVVGVEVQDEFLESGLTFLRFPGGRYGDENNIRELQIDQFMELAGRIDAEVTISVRLLGGTPEAAAEMVRYVNVEQGYGVRYWSIGNEPSLYADLQKATEWDTAYYNEQWRIFAEAMLAVDPDIELIGPNIHQFAAEPGARPKDANGLDWMEEFLRANGDLVDVVAFHRYPFPDSRMDPIPSVDDLRNNTREWDEIIPAVRALILETTGEEKRIGVMEINSNWSNAAGMETTPDGFYNAIWWGDVLGRMIDGQVDMVTHFALQHQRSGWGMLARTEPRPTYFVYRMYQHFGDELLFSQSDDGLVSVVAAENDEGAVTVMVINLGDEAVRKDLTVVGLDGLVASEIWRLADGVWAESLGGGDLSEGVDLPAQTMSLYVFERE